MNNKIGKIIEVKEFDKSNWTFYESGLVKIVTKDNSYIELQDAILEHKYIIQKPEYLPLRFLVIIGENTTTTKEVRDFANDPERQKTVNAQAYIVESLAHKILVNFMKNFYKTPKKFKVFSNEEEAAEWLLSQ
jgi:hypothetical protein